MSLATTELHIIRANEVDINRRLTLPAMINLMQETAWSNTEDLSASVYHLQDLGLTWVVTRLKITIYDLPLHRKKVYVETWPSGTARAFVYRDYRVYSEQQKLLAEATSTWIVLDFVNRNISRLPEEMTPRTRVPEGYTPLPRATDRIVMPEKTLPGKRFSVRWHDLDPNGHVNNMLYFQWALEALPEISSRQGQVAEMDMIIRTECGYGDTILSRIGQESENVFVHEIVQESEGRILAQARTVMR